jgi:hypothetical protein
MKHSIQTLIQNIGAIEHKTKIEVGIALAAGAVIGFFVLWLPVLWNEINIDHLFMGFMTNLFSSP